MASIVKLRTAGVSAVRAGAAGCRDGLRVAAGAARRGARRVPVVSAITGVGWIVIGACAAGWIAGRILGWREFILAAAIGVAVCILCAALMIGGTPLEVAVRPERTRFTVGESSPITIEVRNRSRRPLLMLSMQLAVGTESRPVPMPFRLGAGQRHSGRLDLPGLHRGVLTVGPATSVRGDPFGLFQRRLNWGGATEVFIHPRTERLVPFGSGLWHDLEGRTTEDRSMSDLAFHTLREYVPGDDRRHIHWPSSAKLATIRPEGTFLVRQFRDTRRTHVLVIVDGEAAAYADEEDLETAISVGASLGVQTARDSIDATLFIADQRPLRQVAHGASARRVLDTCARAGTERIRLERRIARAARQTPSATYVIVVTGSRCPTQQLRAMATPFPSSTRVMVIGVNREARTGVVSSGAPTVANLARLHDLRTLIRRGERV